MSNFKSSLINDLAVARLGQPGGFAKLDENGLVTSDQLPGGGVGGGLSWVPQSFTPNSMNPFNNGLPEKLDANGNPNVYHFNSSGPVSTDGTTVFAVQQNERLWYRTDTDSWYHEKNTPQYLGASAFNAGTAGVVPLAQQGQQNFVFKGDGSWGGAWGNLNASGGPIPDGKYLIDAATAITITLDEAIGEVRLFDYKGLVATNNITVGTNTQTFTDASGTAVAGPYIINTNNEDITFVNNTGTNAFTVVKRMSGTNSTVQPLTYGRVRANLDLASTTHINTAPGTKIPFTISTYLSGMTDNAGSLIPSVSGRYRADWLCMASSTDFLADGIFYVVQNGVSVGQVSYNMNEASAVNQSAGFIDVDLVVGQEVSLHYSTRHTTTDGITWDRGSYFQLTQLPTGTIQQVTNTVYEDNSAVLGSSVNIPPSSTNASNATDVMSFTLPSAGVWEVKYNIRATTPNQTATSVTGMVALITNNSNVTEASSEIAISRFQSGSTSGSGNYLTATGSGVTTITTIGAETFKLRAHHDGSANGTQSFSVQSDNNGRTKVSWVKKAGQLPSTGTTVDYVNARLTADTLVASNTAIPYVTQTGNIPNAGGVFTLTAGKTYRLTAMVAYAGTESITGFLGRWRDITNNATLGADGAIFSLNLNSASSPSSVIEAIVTPSTNIQVRLEQTSGSSKTFYGAASASGQNWATIVQLGSTSNTVGTLPANDQSSAGYFDIGNMRMQWGRNTVVTSGNSITLPVAFANNDYVVQASSVSNIIIFNSARTTTTFNVNMYTDAGGLSSNNIVQWFAIGQKP